MYLGGEDLTRLLDAIGKRFGRVSILMDAYSVFAAKMSKIKNPINDVGVTDVYGIDDPAIDFCGDVLYPGIISFAGRCHG